jgi:hypothetical protein
MNRLNNAVAYVATLWLATLAILYADVIIAAPLANGILLVGTLCNILFIRTIIARMIRD